MSNCLYTAQGDFVCNKDTKEHFGNLPGGPYIQTCVGCSYENNILKCYCKNNQDIYKWKSKYCTKNNISNNNGNLICK